ncbi:MAG: NAD(P)H-dependent oxidoreductase subunit E, partial [SAR202 cluster bacterium]|nr:NAD(P)H-dependent oxidoreductase subunit E [SAR202 cluster bacterium]
MQAKTQYENTKELLSKNFPPEKSSLLQALHLIQKTQGFVSQADMLLLSKYLKVAKSEIFGAITSYPEIKTQIENDLKRCDGISCVINTKNIEIKLETTDCKFKCFNAPIGYQNHKYYSLKTPTLIPLISDQTPIISSNSILNKNIVLEGINEIKNTKFETYNKIYKFNAIKTTLNHSSEKIIDI